MAKLKKLMVSLFDNAHSVNPIIIKEGQESIEIDRIEIRVGKNLYIIMLNDENKLFYEKSINNQIYAMGIIK